MWRLFIDVSKVFVGNTKVNFILLQYFCLNNMVVMKSDRHNGNMDNELLFRNTLNEFMQSFGTE